MTQVLRRFIPRAPRYILRPNDDRILRFAQRDDRSRSFSTRFLNVSETGLAFVVSRDCVPALGDMIKVEFPIPGGEQVAWFARVVRVQEMEPERWLIAQEEKSESDDILIGVHFDDLPEGHRLSIKQALNQKFVDIVAENRRRRRIIFREMALNNWKRLLIYALCFVFTLSVLYAMSRPSKNYDAQRGAPWGERFKNLGF